MGRDCCCTGHHDRHEAKGRSAEAAPKPTARTTVSVVRGQLVATVDLGHLVSRRIGPARCVCLADLWVASRLPGDLVDLVFDFVADDGFRPSRSQPRVGGATLARGFLALGRRDVIWDEALVMPCAYRVKGVALVVADEA